MQQLILYLPMLTVYLTIDKDLSPDRVAQVAKKIQGIDKIILDDAVNSLFFANKTKI
jgi:hypothetical protein